jgi:hypothetical protein
MERITTSVLIRAAISSALCLSFVVYPQLRLSSVQAASSSAADFKSETQLRTEASRYDSAIRAIGTVASIQFNTPEDLKKALVILDRERPNLRFHRSKFVVIGLSDTAFVTAARKQLPNKQIAEAFATRLATDSKLALTVEGAASLATRIQRSIESDAATLRRASERLKEAAARFKRAQARINTDSGSTDNFKILKAGFTYAPRDMELPETSALPTIDPASIAVIVVAIIVYAAVIYVGVKWYGPRFGIGTEEDKDQVAECQDTTDGRYATCVSEASGLPSGLPFFVREVAEAACYADWLARQAACLTLYI